MTKLIVVEGTDGTGKTSLVKELQATAPFECLTLHAGQPRARSWRTEYTTPLTDLVAQHPDHSVVCDRWHVGELVWPEVFRRPSLYNGWFDFTRAHAAVRSVFGGQVLVVLLVRDPFDIAEELEHRSGKESAVEAILGQERYLNLLPTLNSSIDLVTGDAMQLKDQAEALWNW